MAHFYQDLADLVLLLHSLFVIFVIAGLFLTIVGGYYRWHWVLDVGFRVVHLLCIFAVIVQSWVGILCPLTTLEVWLRRRAGDVPYDGSFVRHWLEHFLYYSAPEWVFTLVYTTFGLLVFLAWVRFPPVRRG